MIHTRAAQRGPMARVAFASMTGTVIEFYDFFVYGTAAALVFNKVFFPELGAAKGTLVALATFGVAFVARPFGSVLFGHYGDRIGRKRTLVTTLLMMGLSTVVIGILPSTDAIGVLAPILLVVLRVVQGLAVGGEWAGATLLAAENAPKAKRGKYALYPQLGPSVAFALSSATFLVTALTMSDAAFLSWGWRLPFIGSILLVGVGLFVRLKIEETESFTAAKRSGSITKLPVLDVITRQPREIVLGAFMTTTVFGFFYIGVTYLTTYGTAVLEHPRTTVLALGILGGTVFAITTIVGSIWSDKAGRRRLVLSGNIASIAIGIIAFPVLDIGSAWAFGLGMCLVLGVVGFAYGPVGAMLPELFSAQYRYTGAGLAYNLAGVLGGAVTPLVATALVGSFGSIALGFYLALLALVSTLATVGLRDTRHVDMVTVVPPAAAAEDLQGAPQ